ncbi:hypothetical protein B0T19DRAFT_83308 [Cercophora scortea]|uniref:Secreted protein n=1 Tax=Cercophora scortea TaxID=314031 RepID=A0AAE0IUT5_9PEZI|nr:hypothetical protein B0T19DRAFT_83308 [Cercophora scortea]
MEPILWPAAWCTVVDLLITVESEESSTWAWSHCMGKRASPHPPATATRSIVHASIPKTTDPHSHHLMQSCPCPSSAPYSHCGATFERLIALGKKTSHPIRARNTRQQWPTCLVEQSGNSTNLPAPTCTEAPKTVYPMPFSLAGAYRPIGSINCVVDKKSG